MRDSPHVHELWFVGFLLKMRELCETCLIHKYMNDNLASSTRRLWHPVQGGGQMAQKRRSLRRRAALLAKRYGLVGKGRVLATCVVCVAALTGIGLARLATRPAVTIERDVDAVASSDAGDGGDASAVGATTYATRNEEGPAKQTNEAEGETPGIAHVVVHVDGAVANPGVYDVANDVPRVNDAIVLAGGLAEDADTSSLNLASPLQDGQKVHVPHEGEEPAQALSQTASPTSEHADAEAASQVLASLVEDRYVDDARYASAFAREKAALQGWGPVKIRFQLRAKGVSEADIAAGLEEVEPAAAADKLSRVLAAKARTLEGDPQRRLKLIKFGLSRGYEYDAVEAALKGVL